MGRCDHLMGLTEAAAKMVEGASILVVEEGRRLYPDGREEPFRRELVESWTSSRRSPRSCETSSTTAVTRGSSTSTS